MKAVAIILGALALSVFLSLIVRERVAVLLATLLIILIWIFSVSILACIRKKFHWRTATVHLCSLTIFATSSLYSLPLKLAFSVYEAEFENAVARLSDHSTPSITPMRIGPFTIHQIGQRKSGVPYLATNKDSWEINGFVRHPEGHGFNLWSEITLNENWAYIAED